MQPVHGNNLKNKKLHHLYQIWDSQKKEVFKYGISADPIDKNGLSFRIAEQLELYNLAADANRYTAKILLENIPGRKIAEQIEVEHILAFEKKHGRKPRANRKKIKPTKDK